MALGPLRFTNALGGLVDFTYPGPAIDMQSPASAGAVNGTVYEYYAQSLDMTEWEIGTGAYNAGTGVFARTTISANSLGTTAKINFFNPPEIAFYDLFVPATIPGAGTAPPLMDVTPAVVGTSAAYAREDHRHPVDTSRAPLASPSLTGVPTAPTAPALTGNTTIATTLYTDAAVSTLSSSVTTALAAKAPLASPALTGVPTAPTAAVGTNNTQIATTAFVKANGVSLTPGAIGSFSLGSAAIPTSHVDATGSPYPGTWVQVSFDSNSQVTLWQRTA